MDVTVVEEHIEPTLDSPSGASSTSIAVAVGHMVGRYEVLALLGQGGMGTVYTARDPDLERTVALKLLHAAMDDQRLEREARGLARVSHPNIIAVYDVGRSHGRLFVAMEFVEGLTLRKWLQSERRSDDAILSVFLQAGRGLEAAHVAGLVHRDFKPDNVLIGHDGRVRVLDFGLVGGVNAPPEQPFTASSPPPSPIYDYDSASARARLTENGSVLGTPAYMAPEQYTVAMPDPRSDQFSYCVALWEALYGRRPFESGSILDLMMRLRTGPPPEVPRGSTVPEWLERLLRRGLSRQPDARFPSMTELLGRLESSLERTRAREQLVGQRYRAIGPGFDDGLCAIDTFTDQQVVLRPTASPLDFELLGSFEHPNIVPVVDVAKSPSGDGHYLVLDLAQPRKTFDEAARTAPLAIRLEWLSELLRAFLYLHRRRIAHAAPAINDVLIVGGRVKLLVTRLTKLELEAQPSRDLALVGTLLGQLSELSPALSSLASELAAGAGQFSAAAAALRARGRAMERARPVETPETRESLLRAMPLRGRSDVLSALRSALSGLSTGSGSAFFIEGESGVGKSRLLDDFRRAVVASGVSILEGRAEASVQSPYRAFRLPLLRLSLRGGSEALDDFQLDALAPLIPELPARLGRAAKGTPTVDAEPSREALSAVVVSLFRAQREPTVLLLEDLQWAGSEGFALLDELVGLSAAQPLLIVCSCRSEERSLCPALPAAMRTLALPRFAADDIGEACAALIGANEPVPPELVQLLLRETEGNAFFLVEALRALAEEAGSLAALRTAALPDRIFAGGIQTLIRRHLSAVSERGRPLLRAAAVLGRTTDPAVLRALEPDTDVDAWVSECVSAAVLERVEGGRDIGLRFRHDKLREALLDELDAEERRVLHARVAAALEQTRVDESQHVAPLARHYHASGNEAKELVFAAQAGEQALYSKAYTEAAQFLERATALAERLPRPEMVAYLRALRAELHAQRSEWGEAQAEIEAAFAAAARPLWKKGFGNLLFLLVELIVHLVRSSWLGALVQRESREGGLGPALVRAADVQLNIALTLGDNLLALGSSLLAMNVTERGRNASVRALLLLALAARAARLRGVTRRYIARAHELLPLTTDRKDLAEALSYFGLYWVGEGKLSRAREYLSRSIDASTSIGYHMPLAWSVGQLSMCASLQGRWLEMLQQAEICENHATFGEATHLASKCTQVLALARLGRLDEADERMASLPAPSTSDSPLTSAIRAATSATLELARGSLPAALEAADSVHRFLPWVSQVPPIWPNVVTAPIEVYLAAWQAARDARQAQAARLSRITRRRIRALYGWARIYPLAQPLADYFAGHAESLSGHDARATELWQRARSGAKARGLSDYERLSAEALAAPRRPLQTIAM